MSKVFHLGLISLMSLLLVVGCASPITPPATVPPTPIVTAKPIEWPTTGWHTSTPEEQGMDSALLAQLFERIERDQINLHSVLIVRNGYLVTEAYFQPYTADIRHQVASVTKSVISSLIGIAIDQGYLHSVDQSLLDFFPGRWIANDDAQKRAITLEHVLNMTSGLKCKDRSGTDAEMQRSTGWIQFMLDLPMAHTPGAEFSYCSGGPLLLSAVLEKATGQNTRDFANTHLFAPLGIPPATDVEWGGDPQGYALGGYGLYLTPRDMAKLGYLYLNHGQWAGQQVVSSQWVTASSTTQSTWNEEGPRDYGYLWWLYPAHGYYAAMGLAGQQIHVVPDRNLVVVFTSALNINNEVVLDQLLRDYILSAAQSSEPLPANAAAAAQLQASLRSATQPQRSISPLSKAVQTISGRTYRMEDNPMGYHTLAFHFAPDQDAAKIVVNDTTTVTLGMDHLYRVTGDPALHQGEALRGRWTDDHTLIVEQTRVGDFLYYESQVTFTDDELTIKSQDKVFGGQPIIIHGTLVRGQ